MKVVSIGGACEVLYFNHLRAVYILRCVNLIATAFVGCELEENEIFYYVSMEMNFLSGSCSQSTTLRLTTLFKTCLMKLSMNIEMFLT